MSWYEINCIGADSDTQVTVYCCSDKKPTKKLLKKKAKKIFNSEEGLNPFYGIYKCKEPKNKKGKLLLYI